MTKSVVLRTQSYLKYFLFQNLFKILAKRNESNYEEETKLVIVKNTWHYLKQRLRQFSLDNKFKSAAAGHAVKQNHVLGWDRQNR